ncbi:MAG: biopolymer transport protein TolR [Myxococcota bacterium]|jgi:biopolymer transport protein TolR
MRCRAFMAKLTPKQRAFVRARSKVTTNDRLDDELNIIPFLDIVINLIMFLLMVTASITSYTQVAVAMPTQSPRPGVGHPAPESLGLTVVLTESGIHVATSRSRLGADCESAATDGTATIPTSFGAYDWEALRTCVAHVRDEAESAGINFVNAAGVAQVILSAEPLVDYQSVIRAMDALRQQDGRSLFPAVLLSPGVR